MKKFILVMIAVMMSFFIVDTASATQVTPAAAGCSGTISMLQLSTGPDNTGSNIKPLKTNCGVCDSYGYVYDVVGLGSDWYKKTRSVYWNAKNGCVNMQLVWRGPNGGTWYNSKTWYGPGYVNVGNVQIRQVRLFA